MNIQYLRVKDIYYIHTYIKTIYKCDPSWSQPTKVVHVLLIILTVVLYRCYYRSIYTM